MPEMFCHICPSCSTEHCLHVHWNAKQSFTITGLPSVHVIELSTARHLCHKHCKETYRRIPHCCTAPRTSDRFADDFIFPWLMCCMLFLLCFTLLSICQHMFQRPRWAWFHRWPFFPTAYVLYAFLPVFHPSVHVFQRPRWAWFHRWLYFPMAYVLYASVAVFQPSVHMPAHVSAPQVGMAGTVSFPHLRERLSISPDSMCGSDELLTQNSLTTQLVLTIKLCWPTCIQLPTIIPRFIPVTNSRLQKCSKRAPPALTHLTTMSHVTFGTVHTLPLNRIRTAVYSRCTHF